MPPEKVNLINILQLLASPELQKKYNNDVPQACIPDELIAQWFDDFFFPDNDEFISIFSDYEWGELMEFHELFKDHLATLPRDFESMKDNLGWAVVLNAASKVLDNLGWRELVARYV